MKIDRVHFYARNAVRTRDWFIRHVGFRAIASYASEHTKTELIALNSAYFLISSPLSANSPVANYLTNHPEGIADIAFRVKDLDLILKRARELGRDILQNVRVEKSSQGSYRLAKISGWQDLQHTLIEAESNLDCCLPISIQQNRIETHKSSNITDIDHVVLNVAQGELNSAVKLYQYLFDFRVQQNFQIQTSKSGLTSQALIDPTGKVQFNINQPTTANSQIQDFIDLNKGSGIQHLALRSQDLIADVTRMSQNNLKFLDVTETYYELLPALSSLNAAERKAVIAQRILVDCEKPSATLRESHTPQSLLMQIFTQPILEQPTFFLEFIERRQSAQGFGQGNFQALFEAVERQTEQRSHTTV